MRLSLTLDSALFLPYCKSNSHIVNYNNNNNSHTIFYKYYYVFFQQKLINYIKHMKEKKY
jgi:hypothetical protein